MSDQFVLKSPRNKLRSTHTQAKLHTRVQSALQRVSAAIAS